MHNKTHYNPPHEDNKTNTATIIDPKNLIQQVSHCCNKNIITRTKQQQQSAINNQQTTTTKFIQEAVRKSILKHVMEQTL